MHEDATRRCQSFRMGERTAAAGIEVVRRRPFILTAGLVLAFDTSHDIVCRSWLRKARSALSLIQCRIVRDAVFASSQYWEALYGSKRLVRERSKR